VPQLQGKAAKNSMPEELIEIPCEVGTSVHRPVVLGFAPAKLLFSLSLADVLNEDTRQGYQRRFNEKHSLDFRKYINEPNSTTIPLTFNLRPRSDNGWRLLEVGPGRAILQIEPGAGKVMVQVDCQHRLGFLDKVDVSLPFMCFLNLDQRAEMEIFSVINSKAKGLNNSLLDYHAAAMAADLGKHRPELFIALQLNSNSESPWCQQLDLGGNSTSGLKRRASLRMMQKAIRTFLTQTRLLRTETPESAAKTVISFWSAVATILPEQWKSPRTFLISKGIGVYALMLIAADLYSENQGQPCDKRYFLGKLAEFLPDVDWRSTGPMKGLGGLGGVPSAVAMIRQARSKRALKVVANG
jgi:DNA sulfur modification protein DndB